MRQRGWAVASAMVAACASAHAAAATAATLNDDGRTWRLEVKDEGATLVVTDGVQSRSFEVMSLDARQRGRAVSVALAPSRRSFVVAMDGLPEWWEISVDPNAAPIFDGLVHDWRMSESLPRPGFLHPRRTPWTRGPVTLAPQAVGPWLVASLRDAGEGCSALTWVHLDARSVVQTLRLRGLVDIASARLDASPGDGGIKLRVTAPGAEPGFRRVPVPVARDGRMQAAVDECGASAPPQAPGR